MTYFDFPGGWGLYNLNGISEKELALTGAHGYATQAEAIAHVNASPSPDQQLLLQAFKASSLSPVGAAGGSGVLSTPSGTGGVSGLSANVIPWLSQGSIWARVGEAAVGLMLAYVGLKAMTAPEGRNVGSVTAKHAFKTVSSKLRTRGVAL